ncbi:MAG: CGNR zinc finger domain-containing protein [Dehalococcoidia bacterium]
MVSTEPGTRQPAPGVLAVVQQFVNTRDVETGLDALTNPEELGHWLRREGLLEGGTEPTADDVARAIRLREALRALLRGYHGDLPDGEAAEAIDGLTAGALLRVTFDAQGDPRLGAAADGVDGAFGRLLAIIYTVSVEGTWRRLKVCPSDTCQWAFYDHSKNRSGTWCTMAVCGNRSKVRAYQQRRRVRA